MRHEATDAEDALWMRLRRRQLCNAKFRRQQVLGRYVVDFFCLEHSLAIELDGGQHAQAGDYDATRSSDLEALGVRVLRFWNHEVLNQLDGVLQTIASALPPHPDPLPEGEGAPARD